MAETTNGPRAQREPSTKRKNQTAPKSTGRFDPSRCDESCGACWFTDCGDRRCCEVEATNTARRELAEALAEGGDRG